MANVSKALVLLNDTMEIPLPSEEGVYISLQYGTHGADGVTAATGTVVLEGGNDGGVPGGIDWVIIGLTPAGGGAVVLSLAAPGLGWAYAPYNRVRARMSVVGGAQGVEVAANARIST